MKKVRIFIRKYISEESGLVTVEWIGITAVVALAGIIISAFIMVSARDLGDAVADNMDAASANIAPPPPP
ncbi:MAG: hypothetical protein COA45_03140 [Zetaproteobacteria bacterium]|nr:MAG: hypothetical protein COA45_03140 [Zetaproteobacteria bacterium]